MFYRVAIQTNSIPEWKWKSTVLGSLNVLFHFLQLHHSIPARNLRVFMAPEQGYLDEMLSQENRGLVTNSVTAEQFLRERHMQVWETGTPESVQQETPISTEKTATVSSELALFAASMTGNMLFAPVYALNPLDRRRQEIEFGAAGDHDCPYVFTLPQSVKEMMAWIRLLEKVEGSAIEH